jgi:hypothetical protein
MACDGQAVRNTKTAVTPNDHKIMVKIHPNCRVDADRGSLILIPKDGVEEVVDAVLEQQIPIEIQSATTTLTQPISSLYKSPITPTP